VRPSVIENRDTKIWSEKNKIWPAILPCIFPPVARIA